MANRKALITIFIASLLYFSLHYYFFEHGLLRYDIERLIIKIDNKAEPQRDEDFLLNTTGCYIPNYGNSISYIVKKQHKNACGTRAIFIDRISDHKIVFKIDRHRMKEYSTKQYKCCYSFATRSRKFKKEDSQISYTKCNTFQNGTEIELSQEVIRVTCSIVGKTIYEDSYMLVKKINVQPKSMNERWNVLLVGLDTMSRVRVHKTMPKTVEHLRNHGWLDFKGYQKVGLNTFPNVMAFLTGKKWKIIKEKCSKGLKYCRDFIIWNKFSKAGYITAYGEDYLSLPDTFQRFKGFNETPTNHYMRPLFITGETKNDNTLCTNHLTSVEHILNYAEDFTNTYKNEGFFGLFWINSYVHDPSVGIPKLLDNDIESFFNNINETGILNNTFVLFMSDHGMRFGKFRLLMEIFYDDKLPMLFMWVPYSFRKLYSNEYSNLKVNQNRLVTAYDLYVTLNEMINASIKSFNASEACPQCKSLFQEISTNRACADAEVDNEWCSCHQLIKINGWNQRADLSLHTAVTYLQNKVKSIKTTKCTTCSNLELDSVIRSHKYTDSNKTYYLVVFKLTPGKITYEATVVDEGSALSVVRIYAISSYGSIGRCVIDKTQREFCVCKPIC